MRKGSILIQMFYLHYGVGIEEEKKKTEDFK